MDVDGGKDLRCGCSRRPLLARYGRAASGELFIHVKVYKGRVLYAEAIFTEGTVRLHCRECLHWTKVKIVTERVVSIPEDLPLEIQSSMLASTERR